MIGQYVAASALGAGPFGVDQALALADRFLVDRSEIAKHLRSDPHGRWSIASRSFVEAVEQHADLDPEVGELAVSDNMIVSRSVMSQQQLGASIPGWGIDDPAAMYLVTMNIAMIWPYDDTGRMVGEDVWEFDDTDRGVIKLDPSQVVTADQAGQLLDHLIKPLPTKPSAAV